MTFRKYLLSILALLAVSLPAIAEEYWFVVWTNSGEQISFPLSERPKVTHSDANLIVSTTTTAIEYSKTEVNKFTLKSKEHETTSTNNITVYNSDIKQNGNLLIMSGFNAGSTVTVFTVSGQAVMSERISNDGALTLNLSPLTNGIYIVSTESITYKFIKR